MDDMHFVTLTGVKHSWFKKIVYAAFNLLMPRHTVNWGPLYIYGGYMWGYLIFHHPWFGRFGKHYGPDHNRCYNEKRWGGRFIGIEFGCRG